MGETIDLYTFFHKIQAEYPHFVVLATDDTSDEGGALVRLKIDEEDSPDHQNIGCTIADDMCLTLGLGQYVPWKYVTEEHVRQAIRYAFTWLNRYLPACKIVEDSARSQKLDYDKMKLGSYCNEAFAPAKTMVAFLEDNKEYLLNFFGEMELTQGIAFLLKLEKVRR